jgi:type IV pilus assembly protein PilF
LTHSLVPLRITALLAGGLMALGLAGCTTTTVTTANTGSSVDLRTASDQTDADRRAHARLDLSSLYYSRGQYQIALDEVKQALVARPDMAEAHNLRGLIYGAMNEPKLAEEAFQRSLQIAPRSGDTLHNHAWFLCQQQQYAQAQAQFERAIAVPTYRDVPRSLLALGVCQARAGQMAEAERSLTRSYELDPNNPTTAFNLADLLFRRGDYERARFHIRRLNQQTELSNAQSLWLAARIEHKLGNRGGAADWGTQVRNRFPHSREAMAFEAGRYDD